MYFLKDGNDGNRVDRTNQRRKYKHFEDRKFDTEQTGGTDRKE